MLEGYCSAEAEKTQMPDRFFKMFLAASVIGPEPQKLAKKTKPNE
jgi:hypothetical protein